MRPNLIELVHDRILDDFDRCASTCRFRPLSMLSSHDRAYPEPPMNGRVAAGLVSLALVSGGAARAADAPYKVVQRAMLGGEGGWDEVPIVGR